MTTDRIEAPRSAEELKTYARDCMRALIKKYNSDGGVFTDLPDKSTGLIYRSAGATSLLLLVNAFEELDRESDWSQIVRKEFENVCQHIATMGFDASPLKQTTLFSPDGPYSYLDSVSWVLSFALQLRLAQVTQKTRLVKKEIESVKKVIANALTIIKNSACEFGGWGFTGGVSTPDLYYSYAVSESLADFGDYVLGESESGIHIKRDSELINYLGAELIADIQERRKRTAKWLISDYLPTLGSQEVDPHLDKDTPKKPHILLYYSYFVIDMLIVNIPDSLLSDSADDFFKHAEERISKGIEHAIYLSRIDFDKARDAGDWWGNYISSSLELSWENFEKPALLGRMDPARTQLFEPGLVPLSLRCNALYAFYVAKGADQKMSSLFQILHENRDPQTGLWDTEGYSLMVTERAIEAIVDYNDYLTTRQGLMRLSGDAYQKIQNLARAIAKTPGDGLKQLDDLIQKEGFDLAETAMVEETDDTIDSITVALAELGPTKVLKTLLDFNRDLLDHYLKSLEEIGVCRASEWKEKFEQTRNTHGRTSRFLDLEPTALQKQIDLEMRCRCVIQAAGLEVGPQNDYVQSIGMHIRMLQTLIERYRKGHDDLWSAGIRTVKLIERTLRFLICFYTGLDKYYLSYLDDRENFNRHEEGMVTEAETTYEKVVTLTPGELIRRFRTLCDEMRPEVTIDLLGRPKVCDVRRFVACTEGERTTGSAVDRVNIANVINRVKHDKPEGELTPAEGLAFLRASLKLFRFLRDGNTTGDRLTSRERIWQGAPIYPAVVSFREQHRRRDGLVICNYRVYSQDWDESEETEDSGIRILSPHEYSLNEQYYCIPVRERTRNQWMFDPFLISCKKINRAFRDSSG